MSKQGQGAGKPLEERFWSRVVKGRQQSDCWKWDAGTDVNGYGWIGDGKGRLTKAHRVSWTIHRGEIPIGMQVNHHCDNPPCANPDHLYLGTQVDNIMDMVVRGRQGNHKGSRNGRSRVDEMDVAAIRILRSRGMPNLTIARSFGISKGTVSHICTRITWSHVA